MNKKVSISKVTDFDKFKCIADKCKFTCCEGWDINIDEKTFNKWKSEDDKFNYVLSNLKTRDCNKSKEWFIDKATQDKCPLLDENGLCKIVKNHGDEYISLTCKTFPRVKNKFEDRTELALSCACPEVVEIISKIDGKIDMIHESDISLSNSSLELKIRETLIYIIKKEEFPLEYRLIVSFQMMLSILENLHINDRKLLIEIENYTDKEYIKEIKNMYSKINLNIEESMEEINNLFIDIVENYRDVP